VNGYEAFKEDPKQYPSLANAFASMSNQEFPTSSQLSAKLKDCNGRRIDGRKIVKAGKSHNAILWRVESVDRAYTNGVYLPTRNGFHDQPEQVGLLNGHSELL
jgi:hypothetical protein